MKRKKTNLKSIKYNRKYILRTFLLSFLLLAVGFGMLKLYVSYNNKRPIKIECKGQTLEESEDKVAAYINDSKSWISEERGKDYSVGVQYDGIIENNTGNDIREWEITIFLPQKGKIDSSWNGTFKEENDTIIVAPLEYNRQIIKGGEQTFGFVLYSGQKLTFDHFLISAYFESDITGYAMFWILISLFFIWVICAVVYTWVYFRIRKLELQREKDRQIISQAMVTFAYLVDAKDQYTQEHSVRVALYSEEIARRMGMSEADATLIRYIALVHDCGKVGVPDAVLNKRGPLNSGEREIVNSHTILGGNVLHHFTAIEGIRDGALYHHERYDGKGYPHGLKGKKIPLCARIICIADAYDAMSSDRCYRSHLSKEKILEELNRYSGEQFDPELVKYMIEMIEDGFTYNIHHYDDDGKEVNHLEEVFK